MSKRRIMLVSYILLLVAIVLGCSKSATTEGLFSEPPDVVGFIDEKEILFIKGSYHWDHAIADAPSPDNLVKDTAVYVVKPNSELTLTFKGEEPQEISAGLWVNQNFTPLPRVKDTILLPDKPGIYVLSIGAKWSGDDRGSYAAAIEVID
ncbi:hypothetical protein EJP82_22380 [Paenibacillus anaericanus]|uniref:Uncharacterized protein n=2 Tax=Paenibacillus TaxID=44249 RepID=A0A433Y1Y4_9BACL|nr:hypothetical protein [Paenibacillus anaericanus]RUT41982.1 hypothetical protein EJP82_22380 [Paenibacillus anaericanus]